ncbi:MAG TPA: TonB-dependent receptor [Bryobacteraceae bacterium]|nr:TonB-dependent receptor [Bryobacteraceae bacterium]
MKTHRFLFAALAFSTALTAQTFRGSIAGTVQDPSGAALAESKITATSPATGLIRTSLTGAAGEFTIPDLPPGPYSVTAEKPGFTTQKSDTEVAVSRVSNIEFHLPIGSQSATVSVNAAVESVETSSTTITGIVNTTTVEDLPMNGRDFRQMIKLVPGVSPANTSINGARTRGSSYMIDGADNNDAFQGTAAVNQGGVAGIAGVLLPVEAIDQFSVATNGSAEMGRNGGGIVNMVIRSGTNQIHGSAFYFNRNEFFAANTPLAAPGAKVRRIRNQQGGFSLGGPIQKNKTFIFTTGEYQIADASNATAISTLSPAWIAQGQSILGAFGVAQNQVTANLISFWPARVRTGPAVTNNYFSTDPSTYNSYNGIIKVDHTLNEKNNVSLRYYGGTGTQKAVVDATAPFTEYFQVAPSHMHNFALIDTGVISPHLVNTLVLAGNYFLQTFNDVDTSPNPIAAGLNTGVTAATLAGSPTIRIAGFATAGATQPSGRIDTTGHVTDTLNWTLGSHQIKVGGEYRRAVLDIFYESNTRGTFTFDGTRGPWASSSAYSSQQKALADFLAGYPTNSSGATIVRPAPGVNLVGSFLQRTYTQESSDWFIHDTWQATPSFSLNFGVRYSYLGPLADEKHEITTFIPGQGIVGKGDGLNTLYPRDWNNFAPRVGLAWTPFKSKQFVIRAGYGVFYDVPAVAFFAANTGGGNGGAAGVNGNPGGPVPIYSLSAPPNLTLQSGVDPFASSTVPILGVLAVSQNLRTPYVQNYNFNLQHGLWGGAVLQVGYVGSAGRKLIVTRDINAAIPGPGSVQSRRPYNSQYPTLGAINEVDSAANSHYNSLQTQLTQRMAKGITATLAYTWSKSIDNASEARSVVPSYSANLNLDRGPSDFDTRQIFTAFTSYDVPLFTSHLKFLTQGWQINGLVTAHTGLPILFRAGTDVNGDGDTFDRINLVGDPFANLPAQSGPTSRVWVNKAAFALPAAGTLGNLGRNAIYGPGFFSIDPSAFKEFRINERFKAQFRAEIFNVLNWTNYANPTVTFNSGSFGTITNTRNGSGAPGLGFGEPRNMQLALKILW